MSGPFGLSDEYKYEEFELDSADCISKAHNNFSITDWPSFQLSSNTDPVVAFKILEAQIPFTFYLFNETNNTFILEEWVFSGVYTTDSVLITIPPGNYTSSTITVLLDQLLTTASPNGWVYVSTFNLAQLKLTITTSSPSANDYFVFSFGDGLDDLGELNPRRWLGFNGGSNASTLGVMGGDAVLVAPNVIQLTGPHYVYINSSTLGPAVHLYLPSNGLVIKDGTGHNGPQIAKVAMMNSFGGVCNWVDPNPGMWFEADLKTNRYVDFFLTLGTSSSSNPIRFNGASFSLKMGIIRVSSLHTRNLGGGSQNNRVNKAIFPTGTTGRF